MTKDKDIKAEALENARKLLDLDVREVSLVDRAAIKREFLVLKRLSDNSAEQPAAPDNDFTPATVVALTKVLEGLKDAQVSDAEPAIVFLSKVLEGKMHAGQVENAESVTDIEKAKWSTAYINDLPDSAFLYIAQGGTKDADGKTTPRSLRYFPVRDAEGNLDLPHLRNALSRIPQANVPEDVQERVSSTAERLLEETKKMDPTIKNEAGQQEGGQTEQASAQAQATVEKQETAASVATETVEVAPAVQVEKQKVLSPESAVAASEQPVEVEKGKSFTATRTSTIKDAAIGLANLLKEVDPAALGEMLESFKAELSTNTKVTQQVVPQGTANGVEMQQGMYKAEEPVHPVAQEVAKADDMPAWAAELKKSFDGLKEQVATIEKARSPSTAATQEGGTDGAKTADVQKSFWTGVLS